MKYLTLKLLLAFQILSIAQADDYSTQGSNSPIVKALGNVQINYNDEKIENIEIESKKIKFSKEISDSAMSCTKSDIEIDYPFIVYPTDTFKTKKTNEIIHNILNIDNIDHYCNYWADYSVIYRVENLIGISVRYSRLAIGAATPAGGENLFNINLRNSSAFDFKDVFTYSGLKEIKKLVFNKISMYDVLLPALAEDSEGHKENCTSFATSESVEEALNENPGFYFNEDGDFIINFSKYTIGPGYCYNIQVKLDFNEIREHINANGPLGFTIN